MVREDKEAVEKRAIETRTVPVLNSDYCYYLPYPYRLRAFEKELASTEIAGATGVSPYETKNGLSFKSVDPVSNENLKRISSFHSIFVSRADSCFEVKTDQAILERSSPLLRLSKDRHSIDEIFEKIHDVSVQKREKQYSLHELHSYKGKYYPQLVRPLIVGLTRPDQKILDPFCGCGTALIEAHFARSASTGIDLNPMACFIAKARIDSMKLDITELTGITNQLVQTCQRRSRGFKDKRLTEFAFSGANYAEDLHKLVPNASLWFSQGVLEQLFELRSIIEKCEQREIRNFFLLTLSSIIKKSSNWDPKQVRQGLLKKPRKDVNVFDMFEKQLRRYYPIVYLYHKIKRRLALRPDTIQVYEHDARHLEFLGSGSYDAVITSPPYATALPYLDTDRLSMYVLGLLKPEGMKGLKELMIGERDITPGNREKLELEFLEKYDALDLPGKEKVRKIIEANKDGIVGFRRRNLASTLYRYLVGMKACIGEMNRLLREGGYCCIIIGNNQTRIGGKDLLSIDTPQLLREMAIKEGFELKKTLVMAPTNTYMVHADNMIQDEFIFTFRKGA